jgi:hypothetical protein
MGQRRPTSLPSPGGTCHLIAHSIRERIAEFRLFLIVSRQTGMYGPPLCRSSRVHHQGYGKVRDSGEFFVTKFSTRMTNY